jgi:hypothetical protein
MCSANAPVEWLQVLAGYVSVRHAAAYVTLNERLTSVSETQDPVALLERLLDIRPNFLNVAGVVKSDNCALVRSPINMLPVGRIQGYCYCLDLDKIFLGFGNGSIGDHLCLPCTLNNKCFLHGHWVRR